MLTLIGKRSVYRPGRLAKKINFETVTVYQSFTLLNYSSEYDMTF